MGKGAYIRIQNKSSVEVTIAIDSIQHVDLDDDMLALQGSLAVGAQRPVPRETVGQRELNGRSYQYIEGEKGMFFQKDGSFQIHFSAQGEVSCTVKLGVDKHDWEVLEKTTSKTGPVMVATDLEEEGDFYRIEVRLYHNVNLQSWMHILGPSIASTPLCRVGLPGTHDSGTYTYQKELGASPDSDLTMAIQSKLEGGVLGSLGGSALNDMILQRVYDRLCCCQSKSFRDQLLGGIRYFDLRIAYHAESQKFYTCHGVYCVDMEQAMTEFANFLSYHRKEIIILDINHVFAFADESQHTALIDMMLSKLHDKLGDKVVANEKELKPQSPVKDYWEAGAQAIILYCHKPILKQYEGKVWHPANIRSPWPNAAAPPVLRETLKTKMKEGRHPDKFYVLQGILTPDGNLIKNELMDASTTMNLETIARRVSAKVVDWVEDDYADQMQNIIIVDFFQNCSMVPAIIHWNRTRTQE